jgi:hypothetical protein
MFRRTTREAVDNPDCAWYLKTDVAVPCEVFYFVRDANIIYSTYHPMFLIADIVRLFM